jgi:hypothetical protein
MANLPREEYPLLTETARAARRVPPAEEFRRGLAALLRGLDPGMIERSGSHRSGRS